MSLYIPVFVTVSSFVLVTTLVSRRLQLRTNFITRHFTAGPMPALEMNVWHWFIYFFLLVCLVLAPSACAWLIWLAYKVL